MRTPRSRYSLKNLLLFVSAFAVIGTILLLATRAAPTDPPGDLNNDNTVNVFDLSILLTNWNQTNRTPAQGDLNNDSTTNIFDLSIMLSNWGRTGGSSLTGRCQHTATRICYNGQLWYINGVNMPWRQWNTDFGGGSNGGVIGNRSEISNRLAGFSNTGSNVVRWWMFEGGAWQINRDGNGKPTSLNPAIYADIDAALELAEQYNLYYNFTIFGGMEDGHLPRVWRTNTTYRQDLANVLAPLFARYKDNPRVMSWEIWNEPEWQYWNGIDGATLEQATDMASRIIAVIRREAPKAMTTVGQARIDGIGNWRNVDLDFDSPHWYDPMTGSWDCAICTTAGALQTQHGTNGRPIVIGEYYQGGGTAAQNVARQNELRNRGYAGAWAWSLLHERTNDQLQVDLGAMTTFSSQHSDVGP